MATKDLIFRILGIDQASPTVNRVAAAMDRLGRTGTTSMALLAGSSGAAGTAVAAALGGLPLVFAGLGAVALRESDAVGDAWRDLGETMRVGLAQDASSMEDTFVASAQEIGAAYTQLRPQLEAAFAASTDDVMALTRGVTGFARNAMPGLVTAVQAAGPVTAALGQMMVTLGTTTGEFFAIIATGAPAAATGVTHLGAIIDAVLPAAGSALVALTGVWAEHGDQVARIVARLMAVLGELGGSALPLVSSSLGVTLDVLEGVLVVIGPMADQLGPLIGMWIALSGALRLVGMSRTAVEGVTAAVANFRKEAEASGDRGRGVGKFGAALGGVMGLLGGPWGVAVLGATMLLAHFGRESESAAGDQRSLASALRDSGGAFDANARQALYNSEAYQQVATHVKNAGLSQGEFIDALVAGGDAFDDLKARLHTMDELPEGFRNLSKEARDAFYVQADASQHAAAAMDSLRGIVVGATRDFEREREALYGTTAAMLTAMPGATSLREAMKTLKDETADTSSRVDALNAAWRRLFGISITMEEATAQFEAGLDEIRTSIDGAKEAGSGWMANLISATGQLNITTEAGRTFQAQLVEQGNAYRELAQTSYDTALQQGQSQQQATAATVAATEQRRQQFIAEMLQMGFNANQAQQLANRYLGMPKDVLTTIRAETAQAQSAIDRFIRDNTGRVIGVRVVTSSGPAIKPAGGGMPYMAEGGPVHAGRSYIVGEEGPEIFTPKMAGTVTAHGQSMEVLRNLTQPRPVPPMMSPRMAREAARRELSAAAAAGDDERIVRLLMQALERVSVQMDGRTVGAMQGRQASLIGRTG